MRNLNVYIEGNSKVVHLDEAIVNPSMMTLRHATVFWKYDNITAGVPGVIVGNNVLVYGTKTISVSPGYWDFETLRERLSSENIVLSKNIPDRTCNVLSKSQTTDLKNFGPILGFDKDTTILADTKTKSDRPVDILRGLRYINVKCDAVDIRESTDSVGGRSTTLCSLPIVSYDTLNSSATNYFDINSSVETCSGNISTLRFTVDSNIDGPVKVDVLLNIVVE